jgi:hypothetical protein
MQVDLQQKCVLLEAECKSKEYFYSCPCNPYRQLLYNMTVEKNELDQKSVLISSQYARKSSEITQQIEKVLETSISNYIIGEGSISSLSSYNVTKTYASQRA